MKQTGIINQENMLEGYIIPWAFYIQWFSPSSHLLQWFWQFRTQNIFTRI